LDQQREVTRAQLRAEFGVDEMDSDTRRILDSLLAKRRRAAREEIYPNVYTKNLNNLVRFVERQGRGYSFGVLRAKVLFHVGRFFDCSQATFEDMAETASLLGGVIVDAK
jgi:hypothetical protein